MVPTKPHCSKNFWVKNFRIGLCLFLWLTLSASASASNNIRFQHIVMSGTNADVGSSNVITQDELGFIWIGSENGIARYDGIDFVIYQNVPADPHSLSASYVWDMVIDHDGVLWIATDKGLNRYNTLTNNFDHFLSSPNENSVADNGVNALDVDKDNNLIIGTVNGLSILNPERTHFTNYYHEPDNASSLNHDQIRTVFVDSKNRIWIGTRKGGLNLFDRETNTFTHFLHDPTDSLSLINNDVFAIEEDHLGRLWLGTYSAGISRMNADGKTFTNYAHDPEDPTSISGNNIADIFEDNQKNLWISVNHGGLLLYKPDTDSFLRNLHSPYDNNSISSNQPTKIFQDKQGNLWIGSFPAGVNFTDRSSTLFTNFSHKPDDPNSLTHSSILCFFEDSSGMLWIGTENGLNAYDRTNKKFTRYYPDPTNPKSLAFGAVLTIQEDPSGDLWVGTWSGGLDRFNKETQEFKHYFPSPEKPDGINSEFIWKVLRDKDDNIWLATETGGLNLYNPKDDTFTHFTHDPDNINSVVSNQLWTIMQGSRGYLWIATLEGLDRYDINTRTFTHFIHDPKDPSTISSNHILSLHEDREGRIWIGTRGAGINIYDPSTNAFKTIDIRDGLPSGTIPSLIEDDRGIIWATSLNGIVSIDPVDYSIRVFYKSHGSVTNNFNRDASYKDKSGKLYMGGVEGFTVFDPAIMVTESAPPEVVITDFRLFNKSVKVNDEYKLLSKPITLTKKLDLSYKHVMFSFEFAALSYRSSYRNQYAYKLEGFDQGWNMIGTQHSATYTNLDPGDYVFRVKAANSDGLWNEEGTSIAISISSPPWRTWWAYLSYALIFLVLVYIIRKYEKLRIASDTYKTLSTTDQLTGIYNRAGAIKIAEDIFKRNNPSQKICILIFDIDYFKNINDAYGHDVGDEILKEFSSLITNSIRSGDIFARWGGEEFVLLCSGSNKLDIRNLADKLCRVVANHTFETASHSINITTSIGIACAAPGENFKTFFKRADVALYEAKSTGRNRFVIAE